MDETNSIGTGISNHSIEAVLRRTCSDFQGVFSSDTLPSPQRSQFSLVCNLSKVDEPGSHFISIISFPNFVLYLDSLGLPCTVSSIKEFLRQLGKPTFHNSLQVQDVSSDFCGLYCILFILHFSHRDAYDTRLRPPRFRWEKRLLLLNDLICVNHIHEILNKMDRNIYFSESF